MSTVAEIQKNADQRMQKSLEALKTGLAKLRTGRAHAGILDHVMVDYYGNPTPIGQVANVSVADARTITVTAWEKKMIGAIEKAIRDSDLGLNPSAQGDLIRVPMPALTEERRRDMARLNRVRLARPIPSAPQALACAICGRSKDEPSSRLSATAWPPASSTTTVSGAN